MITIKDNTGASKVHIANTGGGDVDDKVTEANYNQQMSVLRNNIDDIMMKMSELIPQGLNTQIIGEINEKLNRIIRMLEQL